MSQKYILPHLPKATSLGDKHALHKDNLATRNGKLSNVIANIKTATSPGGGEPLYGVEGMLVGNFEFNP